MNKEDIQYLEKRIKKLTSSIESNYYNIHMGEDDFEEYPGFSKEWIKNRIIDLYNIIQAYIEIAGLKSYLNGFINQFDSIIKDEDSILLTNTYHPEGEEELRIIYGFRSFLGAFKAFDAQYSWTEETIKLSSILGNTNHIVKKMKLKSDSETKIYNEVKWILGLYYPSTRLLNKASFIQQFKTYNPDILIPELKTAIEYKFIKNDKKTIDDYIDEVRIDASNYEGDPRYENFIAVICLESSALATPESVKVSWNSKHFPPNWDIISVFLN